MSEKLSVDDGLGGELEAFLRMSVHAEVSKHERTVHPLRQAQDRLRYLRANGDHQDWFCKGCKIIC